MRYLTPEQRARKAAHEAFLSWAHAGGWSTATEGLDLALRAYAQTLQEQSTKYDYKGKRVELTLPLLNGQKVSQALRDFSDEFEARLDSVLFDEYDPAVGVQVRIDDASWKILG